MYGTSLFNRDATNNVPSASTADNTPEPVSNSVAGTPPSNISNNGPIVTASPPVIAESVKFGQVGQCKITSVSKVSTRLEDALGSGSAINYADGTFGVSYDTVPGIVDSQQGDKIELCLISIPRDCPAGEDDGSVYSAENLRTKESWSLPNSSHECGGA